MKKNHMKKLGKSKKESGFTLLEILIVLAIIGGIMGVLVSGLGSKADQANVKLAQAGVQKLHLQVMQFKTDAKRLPSSLSELSSRPGNVKRWYGPYATESQLEDPWGNAYQYRQPGQHGKYDIYSYGADGREGGQDIDAEIGSWE